MLPRERPGEGGERDAERFAEPQVDARPIGLASGAALAAAGGGAGAQTATAPLLLTEYEHDQFFANGEPQLYELLARPKTLVTFAAAEGAAGPNGGAPSTNEQVVMTDFRYLPFQ